jgi:hypothetical protein
MEQLSLRIDFLGSRHGIGVNGLPVKEPQMNNTLGAKVWAGLAKVNYRRRVRKLEPHHVDAAINDARKYGVGYRRGGMVEAHSYGYYADTPAVAAIKKEGSIFVRFGSPCANKGHSPVTWFGPVSQLKVHVDSWAMGMTRDALLKHGWIELK